MLIWLIVALVSLLFSALFSGTEMAFVTSDRVQVGLDVSKGGLISKIINKFYNNSEFFISSILVGNNVMLVIYGMAAADLLTPLIEQYTHSPAAILGLQTLISTLFIILLGEFLPKTIFKINPNKSFKIVALPVYVFYLVCYPLSLLAMWMSRGLMRLFGVKTSSSRLKLLSIGDLNEYLEETIDTMEEESTAVENEVKIFQNALDFSSTHLRDCMIPRNEIIAVNIETTDRDKLSKLFTSTGRSKIIVYREDIDNIRGYIPLRELFNLRSDWKEHLMPVLYAPENLLANKMMRRLLQQKRSVAIVIDEFGGTAGMVTLEDLVEEIFGDIQDEHDKNNQLVKEVAPGIFDIPGRCEIEELNNLYHFDLPETDDYQTIAGYILFETGTIPAQGETVLLGDFRLDILKKTASRLELIRLTRINQSAQ